VEEVRNMRLSKVIKTTASGFALLLIFLLAVWIVSTIIMFIIDTGWVIVPITLGILMASYFVGLATQEVLNWLDDDA
jgi:hypothetical protein